MAERNQVVPQKLQTMIVKGTFKLLYFSCMCDNIGKCWPQLTITKRGQGACLRGVYWRGANIREGLILERGLLERGLLERGALLERGLIREGG